ncbi:hypothetical protein BpHYR1_039423 [Brachionus plicatilis]|uniref:Uncharacterized protein n=1 Tax=Brachionus plicatilis TaxID=10195 RepID=A0A3M7R0I7_BRAPC|nr:hypothetical protein BpHYR1_039423 [Brachionus plicatilis]
MEFKILEFEKNLKNYIPSKFDLMIIIPLRPEKNFVKTALISTERIFLKKFLINNFIIYMKKTLNFEISHKH